MNSVAIIHRKNAIISKMSVDMRLIVLHQMKVIKSTVWTPTSKKMPMIADMVYVCMCLFFFFTNDNNVCAHSFFFCCGLTNAQTHKKWDMIKLVVH